MINRFLVFISASIILFLVANLHGSAYYPVNNSNSLQWFSALAADNDTVYIVWADERNGNNTRIMNGQPHRSGDIYLSKGIFQDGWFFNRNIRINDIKGTTGHGSPSIAVDSDNLYAVWEDDRFGYEELYFTYSSKDSIKFSRDLYVVSETGSQALPSIAVLNRTVYIVMMNKKTWDVEFTEGHQVNGIYRFSRTVRINDDVPGNWHYAPSIAVDNKNNLYVVWLDARNNDYDVYFSHGKKENGKWHFNRNIRVNDDTVNASQYTPSISYDNGKVHIVWYDDRNGDLDVYLSTGRLENDNWKFGENTRINDDTGDSLQMHPAVAARKDEVYIVWEDGREGDLNLYISKGSEKNGSIEFGKNIRVNDIKGVHYSPQIEIAGDNIYIVWQGEINDSGDIYFSQGKYNGEILEFSEDLKVNDDLTDPFKEPDPVFLSAALLSVISVMLLVSGRKHG